MGCGAGKDEVTNPNRSKKFSQADNTFKQIDKDNLDQLTSHKNVWKEYQLIKYLGGGSFGKVFKCYRIDDEEEDKMNYAIKQIKIENIKDKKYMLLQELKILKSLDHANIIKFYEVYQDNNYLYIVQEMCTSGDLSQKLHKKKINNIQMKNIMKELLQALCYCHAQGIIHRDLKPENIMFKDAKEQEIKLIDFGLSAKVKNHLSKELDSICGTPYYMAPEVVGELEYNSKVDLWSTGVIFYEMLQGELPFYSDNIKKLFMKIKKCSMNKPLSSQGFWSRHSEDTKSLLNSLLQIRSARRISSELALQHDYFKGALVHQQTTKNMTEDGISVQAISKNLLHQRKSKVLNKELMQIFVNHLQDEEIEKCKDAFRVLDANGDGTLTYSEMQQGLIDQGYNNPGKYIDQIFTDDTEGHKTKKSINYTEFLSAALDKKITFNQTKIWSLFKYFDVTDTGAINKEDLKEIFKRLGQPLTEDELNNRMDELDKDKCGQITFKEFNKFMQGFNNSL